MKSRRRGISLRDFSILASEAETLHLAFLLEMGMGGVWTDGGLLANVKNLLVGSMRFLDAELICAPITYPHRIGPWRVTSAHGEVSKRVEIRRARKLAEIQEQRRRERLEAQEESAWQEKSRKGSGFHPAETAEKMPQWKRRLQQRMNGESANHEGRRRKGNGTESRAVYCLIAGRRFRARNGPVPSCAGCMACLGKKFYFTRTRVSCRPIH